MDSARRAPRVTPLGQGRFVVEGDRRWGEAFGVRVGGVAWVFVDGEVWTFGADAERGADAEEGSQDTLMAPMPARVLKVAIHAGQMVAAGEALVTLEAMKMELPMRAPRNGTVKAVSCQTGQMVAAGEVLVELE